MPTTKTLMLYFCQSHQHLTATLDKLNNLKTTNKVYVNFNGNINEKNELNNTVCLELH